MRFRPDLVALLLMLTSLAAAAPDEAHLEGQTIVRIVFIGEHPYAHIVHSTIVLLVQVELCLSVSLLTLFDEFSMRIHIVQCGPLTFHDQMLP